MTLATFDAVLVDPVSVFIVFMTVVVLYVSFFWSPLLYLRSVSVTMFFMWQFCVWVFVADSLFFVYLAYEASLLPILYIILK